MNSDILVSIVIATWNRKDDLKETLIHYLSQTYKNLEIIVVDNASNDDTNGMIKKDFPSIRLIELNENTGVKAYNIGMKSAKGEIIVVSDNDSFLENNGVEKIARIFQKSGSNLAVIALKIVHIPQNLDYKFLPIDEKEPNPNGYESHLFIGAGAALKKEVLEKVGYYPEEFFMYMNEVDLCTRIIGAGYEIKYFPDIKAFHKSSTQARNKSKTLLLLMRNIIWYYWKYFPIHIALGRSLIRIPFDALFLLYKRVKISEIISTLLAALIRIPSILKNRQVIPRKYVKKALGYKSEFSNLYYFVKEALERRRKLSRVSQV
jgi:hypothetical protein